jgi:anti-anti-sigma regulatory factor
VADEDDLMSLDFTVPGAFSKPPEQSFAPEIPAPPPVAATPALPVPPAPPPLSPALAEAAALYAAGKDLEALRRLETAIKGGEVLGAAAVSAWRCLFELLQVLGRRAAFDALALSFARRFEASPPAWNPPVDDTQGVAEASDGQARVALSGVLNAGSGEILKQAMKLATTSNLVSIDLAKLVDADNDGATLLMRALTALKKAKKHFVLGSPEHLAPILAAKIEPGERKGEGIWLLLLELYQQASQPEVFEDTAINYAVTFEVSPPSWEDLPPRPQLVPALAAPSVARAGEFALRGRILGASAADFAALEAALAERDEFDIEARRLVRIDDGSARQLLDVLTRLHAAGKTLRLIDLSTLVAAYLQSLGFATVAELRTRPV